MTNGSIHVKSTNGLNLDLSDFPNFWFIVSTNRANEKSKISNFLKIYFLSYGLSKSQKLQKLKKLGYL